MKIYPMSKNPKGEKPKGYLRLLKEYNETGGLVENGVLGDWSLERLRSIELTLFIIEVLVYASSIIYFEMKNIVKSDDSSKNLLLYANLVLCVAKIILICLKNSAEFNYLKITMKIPRHWSFWMTDLPKTIFIEFFTSLFFQNPFLETLDQRIDIICGRPDIIYTYTINDFMAIANIVRAVFAFRYIKHFSHYNNNSAKRICGMMNCDDDMIFEMRCYLRERPTMTLSIVLAITVLNFAYLIRIVEFNNPLKDFTNYYNCIWYVCITMGTVGYGDYATIGMLGRIFSFMVAILGVLITNLITVVSAKQLEMKNIETKAFELYTKTSIKAGVNRHFFKLLFYLFKIASAKKKKMTLYRSFLLKYYHIKLFNTYRIYMSYKKDLRKSQVQSPFDFKHVVHRFATVAQNNASNAVKIIDVVNILRKYTLM